MRWWSGDAAAKRVGPGKKDRARRTVWERQAPAWRPSPQPKRSRAALGVQLPHQRTAVREPQLKTAVRKRRLHRKGPQALRTPPQKLQPSPARARLQSLWVLRKCRRGMMPRLPKNIAFNSFCALIRYCSRGF